RDIESRVADAWIVNPADAIPSIYVPVYACPDDPDSFRQPNGLSYVVNVGFIAGDSSGSLWYDESSALHNAAQVDWDGDGTIDATDHNLAYATGVMWRPVGQFRMSFDYIQQGDGQSYTLLFAEN